MKPNCSDKSNDFRQFTVLKTDWNDASLKKWLCKKIIQT